MIFLVSVVVPVDITKWVNIPGALFYLIILPGLMYIWSAKGFKEKRPVYFWLMDAFMVFPPWRRRRKPKIFADSFLDAELLRLREKKIVPQVVLTLKSGEKIRGNCYSYTFTAPREIAIDLYSDEQTERHIVIVKLDENVERLELIFAELPEERRGPFTIVKRLTRCRRAAVISSMEENCWPS
ncbi:MAG TPA: hypothetical protein GXX25_10005 [Desulfotomaculum sp.]|nr:hypothetical protein [Desulfotomaculum sp.]